MGAPASGESTILRSASSPSSPAGTKRAARKSPIARSSSPKSATAASLNSPSIAAATGTPSSAPATPPKQTSSVPELKQPCSIRRLRRSEPGPEEELLTDRAHDDIPTELEEPRVEVFGAPED